MVVVPAYLSYKRKEEKVKNLTAAHSNALEIYPTAAGAPTYDRCHGSNGRTKSSTHTRRDRSSLTVCMHATLKTVVLRTCTMLGHIDK